MLADASAGLQGLGDPGVVTGTSVDPNWDPRFKEKIHLLFLITGDSLSTIAERSHLIKRLFFNSFQPIIQLEGAVRPGAEKGHEHFGFKDCLSQPRVAGFDTPNAGEVPTRKLFSLRFQKFTFTLFTQSLVSSSLARRAISQALALLAPIGPKTVHSSHSDN